MSFVEVHSTCEVHLFLGSSDKCVVLLSDEPIIFSYMDMENPYSDVMK